MATALVAAVWLTTGCGTSPKPAGALGTKAPAGSAAPASRAAAAAPGDTASAPSAPTASPLDAEARWLAELFEGTPVKVSAESDGSVAMSIPMVHAFDPSGTLPKPGLKAVLDRLAKSLTRQPMARLQLAVPMPSQRLHALRAHLSGKGIAAWRVSGRSVAANDAAVGLTLSLAAPAVQRVEDGRLPPVPPGSVRPGGVAPKEPAASRARAGA